MPAANNACIELMPHRIAAITGVRGMFRQTGGGAQHHLDYAGVQGCLPGNGGGIGLHRAVDFYDAPGARFGGI